MKRDLVIYHPGTGTAIPLSDKVYLIDYANLRPETQEMLLDGAIDAEYAYAIGRRIDNYNMTNLFFGEE